MNIRTLTNAVACLLVIAGIVTVNLWHALRGERQATAALRAELASSIRLSAAAQPPQVEALVPAPAQAPVQVPPPALMPQKETVKAPATMVVQQGTVAVIGNVQISEQDLMQDPEYRQARLATLRVSVSQRYPGIAEELGLTKEETERLFDLLTETQLALSSVVVPVTGGQEATEAAISQMNRDRQVLQREQSVSLRAMLGDARYTKWQEYQQTQSLRIQASSYAAALAQAGSPLGSNQLKTLTAAIIEEQKNMQRDILALGRTVTPADLQSRTEAQKALSNLRAASNQRVLDATSSQLSAQQLGLLRAQFEQQQAIDSAAARVRELAQQSP
jgi:hypothetical protein